MQALFSEVKAILRVEVLKQLKDIKSKVDEANIELDDLDMDHFIDRLVMFIACSGNMVLCAVSIYLFLRVRRDIIDRIDEVMRQAGIRVEERRPLLPQSGAGPSTVTVTQGRLPSVSTLPATIRNQGIAGPSHGRLIGAIGSR